jgi:multiple sugar transport system substrate-binding protein
MTTLTRRRLGLVLAGSALGTTVLGMAGRPAWAETRLRLFWWGNPDRNKRTFEVVDLYKQKHPDIVIDAETIGWDDYWPKMATQAAGRNLADVIQMDYRYLFEYARRNQLEPLDDYIGKGLDVSNFDQSFLDSGKVDGKLYAVPWTSNSTATFYDKVKLQELGIPEPDHTWTWDDLREIGRAVKAKAGANSWGIADKGHWEPMMEFFMRQRGKALYTEDGKLAYTQEDVADYFGLWDSFRSEGLLPPGDVTAQDRSLQKQPITLGYSAVDWAHSNQVVALQALNQHELGMTMLPNAPDGKPGQYLKPSMLISVSRTSGAKPAAVAFTSFLAADPEAGKILRVERGVPGDKEVAKTILQVAEPAEKKMIDYLQVVAENVSPLPPAPPKGAGEVDKMGQRLYDQLAFGRVSVKDGAAQFYREAQAIIRRA